jgi:hypothetical protein
MLFLSCPIYIAVGSTTDSKIGMRGKSRVNKIDRFDVWARLAQLPVFESHIWALSGCELWYLTLKDHLFENAERQGLVSRGRKTLVEHKQAFRWNQATNSFYVLGGALRVTSNVKKASSHVIGQRVIKVPYNILHCLISPITVCAGTALGGRGGIGKGYWLNWLNLLSLLAALPLS